MRISRNMLGTIFRAMNLFREVALSISREMVEGIFMEVAMGISRDVTVSAVTNPAAASK